MPWKQWISSRTLRQLHRNVCYVKSGCTVPKIAPSPAQGGKAITRPPSAESQNVQTLTSSKSRYMQLSRRQSQRVESRE